MTEVSTVEKRFHNFHLENPHVYDMFIRFATQALTVGMNRISSKFIINRIRWEAMVTTAGENFKIDDRFTAWYARQFVKDFPEYSDRIEMRTIRTP
jgi:hypothetical protein